MVKPCKPTLRDISGTSPGHLRDISGTTPEHLWVTFVTFTSIFQKVTSDLDSHVLKHKTMFFNTHSFKSYISTHNYTFVATIQ